MSPGEVPDNSTLQLAGKRGNSHFILPVTQFNDLNHFQYV